MITKGSYNKENCSKSQFFFNSARDAFELLLKKTFTNADDTILMPGYIGESAKEGSGVFDPVRHTRVKFEFYKINSDLSADLEDIKRKMLNVNVKAILLIHYFGFPQKCVNELSVLCKEENIILIEDCAHTFSGKMDGMKLGSTGDFALFSIHKLLTTDNGGMLQVNNGLYKELFNGCEENIQLRDLLTYAKSDMDMIAERKVENYKTYLQLLNKESELFEILYPELQEGVVPNNFPVIIKNYDRFKLYNELDAMGIPTVVLYYRMIEELNKEEFPISFKLADTILNLPVHQDTEIKDIKHIAEVLNTFNK